MSIYCKTHMYLTTIVFKISSLGNSRLLIINFIIAPSPPGYSGNTSTAVAGMAESLVSDWDIPINALNRKIKISTFLTFLLFK